MCNWYGQYDTICGNEVVVLTVPVDIFMQDFIHFV